MEYFFCSGSTKGSLALPNSPLCYPSRGGKMPKRAASLPSLAFCPRGSVIRLDIAISDIEPDDRANLKSSPTKPVGELDIICSFRTEVLLIYDFLLRR